MAHLSQAFVGLQIQLDRTVDWLNSLPLERLDRAAEGGSIAVRAWQLSQQLVDLRWRLPDPPGSPLSVPELPRLRAHGAGSQLAVVGRDLLRAGRSAAADEQLASDVTSVAEQLRALRRGD